MPKRLPFSKDEFHRIIDRKLQPQPVQQPVIEKLKIAAQQVKARLGGTALP